MHDVQARPIAWAAAALLATIALAVAAALGLLHVEHRSVVGPPPPPAATPPDITLSSDPQDELARQRRAQQARLDSAGWVDRDAGLVHIPIADAMDILIASQRGAAP